MNIETKTCLANAYRDAWNADWVEGSVMYIERTMIDAPVYKSIFAAVETTVAESKEFGLTAAQYIEMMAAKTTIVADCAFLIEKLF
jgi:hypothetical protein